MDAWYRSSSPSWTIDIPSLHSADLSTICRWYSQTRRTNTGHRLGFDSRYRTLSISTRGRSTDSIEWSVWISIHQSGDNALRWFMREFNLRRLPSKRSKVSKHWKIISLPVRATRVVRWFYCVMADGISSVWSPGVLVVRVWACTQNSPIILHGF